jgi:hypothetical protein
MIGRERAFPQAGTKSFPFKTFEYQVGGAVVVPNVVQNADVGMRQLGDGAGFALEALAEFGILREMFGEDFDGDVAIQPRIASAIHLTHAPRAQRRLDFIRPEFRSRGKGHPFAQLYSCPHIAAASIDSGWIVAYSFPIE